jgi:VHL beta domain
MTRAFRLNRTACAALSAIVMLAAVTTSHAAECEPAHDPAPQSDLAAPIAFFNDTPYALRLYWIDYDGFLTEYGLIQPTESASFDSFVGHQWLAEAQMPEGAECVGPISPNDPAGCSMHILYDNGFGYDGGMCDF